MTRHPMINSESSSRVRTASFGSVLAVLTFLFGQGMGIVFRVNEDAIKSRLKSPAAEVRDTVCKRDDAAIKAVLNKSWTNIPPTVVHRADFTPAGRLHPRAIAAMAELGLNISGHRSKPLAELVGQPIDVVSAVCANANAANPRT